MRRRLDSLRRLIRTEEPISVFVVIESSPLMTVSGGFIDQMITAAGGRNIAAGDVTAYPRYSREVVLRDDPDVVLISGFSADAVEKLLLLYPEWKGLRAARNGKIIVFDSDLLSRPGPRLIDGIIALRKALKEKP
jgi:iron complex transport system substrate-binding protein